MRTKLLFVSLLLAVSVSAQNGEPELLFRDICPSEPAPRIEQLNPPVYGAFFWTQYIDNLGDRVLVSFDGGMNPVGQRRYAGDWCDDQNS